VKRVVLVGLGRFGQNHLRVLSELGVPLALVDHDAKALEKAKKAAPDALCAKSVDDLLKEAFAADIVVPADQHRPLVARCLEEGLAVFCEKPLARTSEDARFLAELAERKKAVLQTGFIFRHHAAFRVARGLLAEGAIGEPHTVRARFTGFKRPRTDGGCAVNDAVHFVDLASVIFGRAPEAALGATRAHLGAGVEDLAFLAFDFGNALCHIEVSYFTPKKEREVLIVGTRGSIAIDFDASEVALYRQAHGADFSAVETTREMPPIPQKEALRAELEDFLSNARNNRRPEADGLAGARATAAIEAALESARLGKKVAVV
jgi:predicted dehydrogenase